MTTKVSNTDQRESKVWLGVQKSRVKLRRRRINLLLLHWPYPGKFAESWKVLEGFYRKGVCRAIGVANFKVHHLEALMESAEIAPHG
ncbi:aldo/keto reductase [Collinsella ihumii]|uniref:Aldo/keto reductase n=1 Tax=Collinsella ihumii TaxID=1720204 RepID=A0AAW7JRL8_9ACTN|nr:aldo/keto reductase [Collinsella ihumii]MDN0069805.1 aldo/keto reductase [Collinsella ihumii]